MSTATLQPSIALGLVCGRAAASKRATSQAFRHSFATHVQPSTIRTVQELLGQKAVPTATTYTHALNRGGRGVRSPADGLTGRG